MPIVKKGRGRPPTFDSDKALDQAMNAFWAYGFEGTSMSTLTQALGINKASIYGAFGSKEELFDKTVERYLSGPAAFVKESLNEPTAYKVVERMLNTAAAFFSSADHPHGCLVIQSALSCSAESSHIHDKLSKFRFSYEAALYRRFLQAIDENDLPESTDAKALAKFIATIHQGMSVQSASGASKNELLKIAKMALKLLR